MNASVKVLFTLILHLRGFTLIHLYANTPMWELMGTVTWVYTNTRTWELFTLILHLRGFTLIHLYANTPMWELMGTVTWVYTNTRTWELNRYGPDGPDGHTLNLLEYRPEIRKNVIFIVFSDSS